MANDTVVQYILKIDAQGATQGLDRTGKAAQDTSQSIDRMGQSTDKATDSLKRNEKQTSLNVKAARNFRRAGRDLDGALGDLAQGIGILNPQFGQFLISASDGVSIVEAFGRAATLLLNPAVFAAAAIATSAGVAVALYSQEQEKAAQRAKELAAAIEESNRIIEEQSKIASDAQISILDYANQVEEARIRLQLITGQLTEFQNKQNEINAAVDQFGQNQTQVLNEERAALQAVAVEQDKKLKALNDEIALLKEARRIRQTTLEESRTGPRFSTATQQERDLRKQQQALQAQRTETEQLLKANSDNFTVSRDQKKEYEEILNQILQAEEAQKRRAEFEKARQNALKEEARLEREFAQLERQAEANARKAQAEENQRIKAALTARQQLATLAIQTEPNARQKIIESLNVEIARINELASISGDRRNAEQVIANLRANAAEQLKDLTDKETEELRKKLELEKQIAREKRNQISLQEINQAQQRISALSTEEIKNIISDQLQILREKFNIQNLLNQAYTKEIGIRETAAAIGQGIQAGATGSVSDIVSLINPALGSALSFLQSVGEKTPAERQAELNEQIEAIRLGLSYLPELLLQVLPQITLAIVEGIVDGVQLLFKNLIGLIIDAAQSIFSFRDRSIEDRQRSESSFLSDFFNPNKSASYMSGGRFIPKAQGGIRFTGAQDGFAMLHRGEFVVPQSGQRPQQVDRQMQGMGGGLTVNINSAVVDRNAVDALVRQIEIRFNNQFGTSSSNLFGGS